LRRPGGSAAIVVELLRVRRKKTFTGFPNLLVERQIINIPIRFVADFSFSKKKTVSKRKSATDRFAFATVNRENLTYRRAELG
jgi:hypothetical protein